MPDNAPTEAMLDDLLTPTRATLVEFLRNEARLYAAKLTPNTGCAARDDGYTPPKPEGTLFWKAADALEAARPVADDALVERLRQAIDTITMLDGEGDLNLLLDIRTALAASGERERELVAENERLREALNDIAWDASFQSTGAKSFEYIIETARAALRRLQ